MQRKFLAKLMAFSMVLTAAPAMPNVNVAASDLNVSVASKGGGTAPFRK